MKKQRNKPQPKRKNSPATTQSATPDRRAFLRLAKNAAIGLPIVGIGCYLAIRKVQGDLAETDLSRVGNGIPAVVQIHDPQCPQCQTLQRQTRSALSSFDDSQVTYLVADVTSQAGLAFATKYGVSHVTLILFTAAGDMVDILRGPVSDTQVDTAITAHLNAYN